MCVRAFCPSLAPQSAAEMLIFLFQMSFVQLGQDIAIEQLSPSQLQFKEELANIGLICTAHA